MKLARVARCEPGKKEKYRRYVETKLELSPALSYTIARANISISCSTRT